jgi:hypothetical protein
MPYLLTIAILIAFAGRTPVSVALAQDAAPQLTGTVTLRGGQTLTGVIKSADLGIMSGAGIGTSLNGNGGFKIVVDGQVQEVPAANITLVEVSWQDKSTPEEPKWDITELKITTTDGKVLVGKPNWFMHATNVSVQLASGENKRVHAFPLAGPDFSPDNLIVKIEVSAPGAAPATPPATPPATTTPAIPPPTTVPLTTIDTREAPTTPGTVPTTTTTITTVGPATTGAPIPVTGGAAVPVTITLAIPGTDKKVTVLIYVTIVEGEVKVLPAVP